MTPRIGEDFVGWKPPAGGDSTLGIVDFSIFPHLDHELLPENTLGDQFIAISEPRSQPADDSRHFGLVVDDVGAARAAVTREGLAIVGQSRRSFDFLDRWGNRFQVVGYGDIQFDRVDGVKRKLGIEELEKTEDARRQISERGLG